MFIEDLDEYLYHIDRMLQNLKRNGMLDQLEGLIIGRMTHMHHNDIPFGQSAEEIILSICDDYNYPIVRVKRSSPASSNMVVLSFALSVLYSCMLY